MTDRHDQAALCALSDALADAASVHASAREVADNPAVAQELAAEANRLREFSAQVRDCPVDSKPGSALQLVDQLKLLADRLLDDNDAAARAASRESIAALLNLVDDHLRSPELSPEVVALFSDMRERISRNRDIPSKDAGLKTLPS